MEFADAVMEHRLATEAQHRAEQFLTTKAKEVGQCERDYREGLAKKILEMEREHPATLAKDLARGDAEIAGLEFQRIVAEGLREAAQQSIWRHTADRRDLEQFLEWSKRASFLDTQSQPEHR
jgi:hypothetical protein